MSLNIQIQNKTKAAIDKARLTRIARAKAGQLPYGRKWQIDISLVTDSAMQALNRTYLGQNYPTDVLSFPIHAFCQGLPPALPAGPLLLGEIVINLDAAQRAAHQAGHSWQSEVQSLVAHGICHLIGFHHS